MRRAALAALLALCAGPARALDAAPSTAPVSGVEASTAPAKPKYLPPAEVRQAVYTLNLLAERGGEVPAEKLAAFLPELAKFNSRLEELLGRGLLEDAAARDAQDALKNFRNAIQLYYAAFNKYPENPAALVPGYLQAVPELRLAGHAPSAAVKVTDASRDGEPAKAAGDSGGWLYFYGAGANSGLLLIDCTHKDPGGQEFAAY